MDLERDDDARRLRGIRKRGDVGEERSLAFVGALVSSDSCVDDRDSEVGGPANALDPVLQALRCRQVGVRADADRGKAVLLELSTHLAGVGVQVHVLGPAGNRRQLNVLVARLGDSREGLVEAVRVVCVRVTRERVRHGFLLSGRVRPRRGGAYRPGTTS